MSDRVSLTNVARAKSAGNVFSKYADKLTQILDHSVGPTLAQWARQPPTTPEEVQKVFEEVKSAEQYYTSIADKFKILSQLTSLDEETTELVEMFSSLVPDLYDLLMTSRRKLGQALLLVELPEEMKETLQLSLSPQGCYIWPCTCEPPIVSHPALLPETGTTESPQDDQSDEVFRQTSPLGQETTDPSESPDILNQTDEFSRQYWEELRKRLDSHSARQTMRQARRTDAGHGAGQVTASALTRPGTNNNTRRTQSDTNAPNRMNFGHTHSNDSSTNAPRSNHVDISQAALTETITEVVRKLLQQQTLNPRLPPSQTTKQNDGVPQQELEQEHRPQSHRRSMSFRSSRHSRRRSRDRSSSSGSNRSRSPSRERRRKHRVKTHTAHREFDSECSISSFVDGQFQCHCREVYELRGSITKGNPHVTVERMKTSDYPAWRRFMTHFNINVGKNPNFPPAMKNTYLRDKLLQPERTVVEVADPFLESYTRTLEALNRHFMAKTKDAAAKVKQLYAIPFPRTKEEAPVALEKLYTLLIELKEHDILPAQAVTHSIFLALIPEDQVGYILNRPGYAPIADDTIELSRWAAEEFRTLCKLQQLRGQQSEQYRDKHSSKAPAKPVPQRTNRFSSSRPAHPTSSKSSESAPQQPTKKEENKALGCHFCGEDHRSAACEKFRSTESRKTRAKEKGYCDTCLRKQHEGKCRLFPCFHCKQIHHTALCDGSNASRTYRSENKRAAVQQNNDAALMTLEGDVVMAPVGQQPVIPTVTAHFKQKTISTKSVELLVALDTHAHINFITTAAAKRAGLKMSGPMKRTVHAFGANPTTLTTRFAQAFIVKTDGSLHLTPLWVIDHFINPYPILKGLPQTLEDLLEYKLPSPIPRIEPDVLLGVTEVAAMHTSFTAHVHPSRLQVVTSDIGMSLSGSIAPPFPADITALMAVVQTPPQMEEEPMWMEQLTSVQHLGIRPEDFDRTEDDEVVRRFRQTMTRLGDGRYQVQYPVKDSIWRLNSQFSVAHARLKHVVDKMKKRPEIWETVQDTVNAQLRSEIIEEVDPSAPLLEGSLPAHYLPFHLVVKDSATTAYRMVLDPTVKCPETGQSLNSAMMKGTPVLPTIYSILLRIRTFPVLVIADVEKAFHQISIDPRHRPTCRWLLPKDINKPLTYSNLRTFQFKRLAFGLKPSPFMLQDVIQVHLEQQDSKLGRETLQNIYVDNLNFEANNDKEAQQKAEHAIKMMADAQMKLREFITNGKIDLPEDLLGDPGRAKLLGIRWKVESDQLFFVLPKLPHLHKWSRRDILSVIHTPFDPLGLIEPLLVKLKKVFQESWEIPHRQWRKELPQEYVDTWLDVIKEWNEQQIMFPRHTPLRDGDELHIFADASDYAMGAVIYAISVNDRSAGGKIITAKGQIIPRKKIVDKKASQVAGKTKLTRTDQPSFTIPQAEAAAARIACALLDNVYKILGKDLKVYFWGDNMAVLSWIEKGASEQPLVIRNILKAIWKSKVSNFGYVSSPVNPADIISRGTTPQQLIESPLWFQGPPFLTLPPDQWPKDKRFHLSGEPIQQDASEGIILAVINSDQNAKRMSTWLHCKSWTLTLGAVSRILQLADKIRMKSNVNHQVHALEHYRELAHIRMHILDQEEFPPTLQVIQKLDLIKDQNGVYRIRGRLQESTLPFHTQHPIFVHHASPLSRSIIQHAHERMAHQGTRATICWFRRRYWIPKAARTAASVIKKCASCSVMSTKPFGTPTSDALPQERLNKRSPFEHTGLDAFGPIEVSSDSGKKKRWVILFTCAVVRAVHLEIVEDCTARAFLHAFLRFKASRGLPRVIISDNQASFKAAANLIVPRFSDEVPLRWKFIDPGCPWQGGFYERLVGMVKRAIIRSARRLKSLSDPDFLTVVKEVEDAINHRPLFRPLDSETEYSPLRPVDFLRPAGSYYVNPNIGNDDFVKDPSYLPSKTIRKKIGQSHEDSDLARLHQVLQGILNDLWVGWTEEYLVALREFEKGPKDGLTGCRIPKPGEAVLIEEDFVSRKNWHTGVVQSVVPPRGERDPVAVMVRMRDHTIKDIDKKNAVVIKKMPIRKLYPLEMDIPEDSPTLNVGIYWNPQMQPKARQESQVHDALQSPPPAKCTRSRVAKASEPSATKPKISAPATTGHLPKQKAKGQRKIQKKVDQQQVQVATPVIIDTTSVLMDVSAVYGETIYTFDDRLLYRVYILNLCHFHSRPSRLQHISAASWTVDMVNPKEISQAQEGDVAPDLFVGQNSPNPQETQFDTISILSEDQSQDGQEEEAAGTRKRRGVDIDVKSAKAIRLSVRSASESSEDARFHKSKGLDGLLHELERQILSRPDQADRVKQRLGKLLDTTERLQLNSEKKSGDVRFSPKGLGSSKSGEVVGTASRASLDQRQLHHRQQVLPPTGPNAEGNAKSEHPTRQSAPRLKSVAIPVPPRPMQIVTKTALDRVMVFSLKGDDGYSPLALCDPGQAPHHKCKIRRTEQSLHSRESFSIPSLAHALAYAHIEMRRSSSWSMASEARRVQRMVPSQAWDFAAGTSPITLPREGRQTIDRYVERAVMGCSMRKLFMEQVRGSDLIMPTSSSDGITNMTMRFIKSWNRIRESYYWRNQLSRSHGPHVNVNSPLLVVGDHGKWAFLSDQLRLDLPPAHVRHDKSSSVRRFLEEASDLKIYFTHRIQLIIICFDCEDLGANHIRQVHRAVGSIYRLQGDSLLVHLLVTVPEHLRQQSLSDLEREAPVYPYMEFQCIAEDHSETQIMNAVYPRILSRAREQHNKFQHLFRNLGQDGEEEGGGPSSSLARGGGRSSRQPPPGVSDPKVQRRERM